MSQSNRTSNLSLSQAIRLGSMLAPQAFGVPVSADGGRCVVLTAVLACGVDLRLGTGWGPLRSMFPIASVMATCPHARCGGEIDYTGDVLGVMIHMNDAHHCTRETIADWVATIEAQQPAIDREHATPEDCACESAVSA